MIQEQHVRLATPAFEAHSSAMVGFVARSRGSFDNFDDKGDKIDKSTFNCTHCKKSGHLAKTCFEIIGYPDWWEELKQLKAAGKAHLVTIFPQPTITLEPEEAHDKRGKACHLGYL